MTDEERINWIANRPDFEFRKRKEGDDVQFPMFRLSATVTMPHSGRKIGQTLIVSPGRESNAFREMIDVIAEFVERVR